MYCLSPVLLVWSVLQIKSEIVSCHTADSKPVKQEANSTVILPPLVFPAITVEYHKQLHSGKLQHCLQLGGNEEEWQTL